MLRRSFLRSLAAAPAASLVRYPCGLVAEALAQQRGGGMPPAEPFKVSEGLNNPLGEGRGIHPGRVAWVRDTKAASWDGSTGNWWDDANTDQKVVDRMMSRVLQDATGQRNDKQAWDALFRNFNETRKQGSSGYRRGEKIAIKINANQDRSAEWGKGQRALNGLPSPHAVNSLVNQLINVAGIPGEDILIFEVAQGRNVGLPVFAKIRANSGAQFQAVRFLVNTDYGLGNRIAPAADMRNPIRFSNAEVPTAYLAQPVTEAKYMINMALLRAHGMAGITLGGKNHFGSVYIPDGGGWTPRSLHDFVMRTSPMGSYNALVDLIGHRHLGGKTLLFMLDGLYTAAHNEGNVFRWQAYNGSWGSSLLASQDPIALDSVGLDILRNEPGAVEVRGNPDNYLHEAAQAAKPPSGTVYDPVKSGTPLASLGVHEHWNNPADKKYSRNLGRKTGIELIASV
jgi:hypothetical protein